MDFKTVKLTPDDLSWMRQLLSLYGEAFDEIDVYTSAPPSDTYLKKLLARDTYITLVAVADEMVIGGLSAYVLEKCEQERREIYLYDLAVAQAWRRRGVATRLIRGLQEEGRRIGAHVIFVQADKVDAPAIALYRSLGSEEDPFHYDIPIT